MIITGKLYKMDLTFLSVSCVDPVGDEHYHCASALQKSVRGSDDNGALYWMTRMLEGGEDPLYVARRLVVTASEDIGLVLMLLFEVI